MGEVGHTDIDPMATSIPALIASGEIAQGARVCFIHTGGLAALFAYGDAMKRSGLTGAGA